MKKSYLLTLVRHGETLENRQGIIQGHMNVPLSPFGVEQARCLGKVLVKESQRYSHVFSSDLQRARQTAETVLNTTGGEELWAGLEIYNDLNLRERNYGTGEGKSRGELAREARSKGIRADVYLPPGAEEDEEMRLRASAFFSKLNTLLCDSLFKEGSAVAGDQGASGPAANTLHAIVFSHGGLICHLLHLLSCSTPFTNKAQHKGSLLRVPPNTARSTFVIEVRAGQSEPLRVTCVKAHDMSHLDDLTRP